LLVVALVLIGIGLGEGPQKYGLIGAAVPLISWLVVVGLLLVLSAVLGAELVRPAHLSTVNADRPSGDDAG
jgi:membrane protein